MKIWDSIRRKWREDTVIRSIVWTSIIEVYKEKKGIDVTKYLESISLSGKYILIKTKKPIINTELWHISWDIENIYQKRLLKIGIHLKGMKLKFV